MSKIQLYIRRIEERDPTLGVIDLSNCKLTVEDVETITPYLKLTTATTLNIQGNDIASKSVRMLTETLKNSVITTFNLANNNLSLKSIQALTDHIADTPVQTLILDNNDIPVGSLHVLVTVLQNSSVTILSLENTNLGTDNIKGLAENIAKTKIKVLNLSGSKRIGPKELSILIPALRSSRVIKLNLAQCELSFPSIQALADHIAGTPVQTLILDDNDVPTGSLYVLVTALKNSNVTTLSLKNTNLGTDNIKGLAENIAKTKIKVLDLSGSKRIGPKELSILIPAFKDSNVTTLNLGNDNLSVKSIQTLATNIVMTPIQTLILADNDLEPESLDLLTLRLRNTLVSKLNLARNKLSLESITNLANNLLFMPLLSLDLRGNPIDSARLQKLAEAMYKNHTIIELKLDDIANDHESIEILRRIKEYLERNDNTPGVLPSLDNELVASDLLQVKNPSKSWHFSAHLLAQANKAEKENGFALLPAGVEDIGKLLQLYFLCPVPGYDVRRVEIIYSRNQSQIFERRMQVLNTRAEPASAAAFAPKWSTEYDACWRAEVDIICRSMAAPYHDPDFPNIKLLPMWHGTKDDVLESVLRAGYACLAKTDVGFFGQGVYFTREAEYAYRVYSQGALILNEVAFYSAYPTIDGDMAKLMGKASYQNYDAHFVPVVPASNKPNEVNYFPAKPNQKHTYTELVVFDPNQCLPRYLVQLQPALPKNPLNLANNPHTLFFKGRVESVIYINLLAAAEYVYENYLSKPYTLKEGLGWQMDWEYCHPTSGIIIPRPNHGLAHTLRKLFYLPTAVEYYISYQKLSEIEEKQLKSDINVMQLALLFFISGRENDLGSVHNETNFHRFRRQSAYNFESYVRDARIQLNPIKFEQYKQALLWFYDANDLGYLKHIRLIMWQCHFIDLLRCLTPEQFNKSISYVEQCVGKIRCEQLVKLAEVCIEHTGDRLLGSMNQHDYQPDLFVDASTSTKKCTQYLRVACRKFEESVQAKPLTIVAAPQLVL
jgi:SidE phosphodiesterase (PDE) domain/Poly(ADP-ribose) polymerase catalytic domain